MKKRYQNIILVVVSILGIKFITNVLLAAIVTVLPGVLAVTASEMLLFLLLSYAMWKFVRPNKEFSQYYLWAIAIAMVFLILRFVRIVILFG